MSHGFTAAHMIIIMFFKRTNLHRLGGRARAAPREAGAFPPQLKEGTDWPSRVHSGNAGWPRSEHAVRRRAWWGLSGESRRPQRCRLLRI